MSEGQGIPIPVTMPGGDAAVALLGRIADAVEKTGSKAKEAEPKVESWGDSLKKVGDGAIRLNAVKDSVLGVVGAIVQGTRAFTEHAIAGERTQTAMAGLGSAFAAVTEATAGTVSATDAYNARQSLTQAHLHVTDSALATITRTAREHARAMGTETPEALARLTDALRQGEAGALRSFGISVQQGATQTQTFASAIRQMEEAQRGAAPAALTLSETTSQLGTSVTNVTNGLALWVASGAGLSSFLTRTSSLVRQLGNDLDYLNSHTPEARAQAQSNDEALVAYTRERAALRAELERTGGDTSALPNLGAATDAAGARQLREAADAMRALRAGSAPRGPRAPGDVSVDFPTVSPRELSDGARALADRVAAERADRERAAGAPADTSEDNDGTAGLMGMGKYAAQQAMENRIARNSAAGAAATAARAAALRAFQNEHGREAARQAMSRASGVLTQRELDDAEQASERAKGLEQSRLNRQETDRGLTPEREAANLAGKGAEQSRLNALEQARSLSGQLRSHFGETETAATHMANTITGAFASMGEAIGKHVQAMVDGKETIGQALQGMLADTLSAIGRQAIVKGAMEMAEGVGALAGIVTAGAAPGHFAAGAAYLAVGSLAGVAGAALSPSTPAGGSAAAGGGRAASVSTPAPANNTQSQAPIINNYYAPTFGGREGTEGEVGQRIDRYRDSSARLRRDRS